MAVEVDEDLLSWCEVAGYDRDTNTAPGDRRPEALAAEHGVEAVWYDDEDPMGQEFKETRTDLDATISGRGTENLIVVEVIKPIVRVGEAAFSKVVQKGIVVVESKEGNKE